MSDTCRWIDQSLVRHRSLGLRPLRRADLPQPLRLGRPRPQLLLEKVREPAPQRRRWRRFLLTFEVGLPLQVLPPPPSFDLLVSPLPGPMDCSISDHLV